MSEERVVSETGGEKGKKDIELGFLDPLSLEELGRVASMGCKKYASFNYLRGYDWSLSYNALLRHLLAFLRGETLDPESGLQHMAHAAWHGLCLTSFSLRGIGKDDRPPADPEIKSIRDNDAFSDTRKEEWKIGITEVVKNGHKISYVDHDKGYIDGVFYRGTDFTRRVSLCRMGCKTTDEAVEKISGESQCK